MKLKTRLKLKVFKIRVKKAWYKFWEVLVFKPISKPYLAIQDRKLAKRRDGSNYHPNKLKKLLYKTIQDRILVDECFYIFDIDFIPETEKYSNFIKLRDLFTRSTHKYLSDYWYEARNPLITKEDMWDVIVGFNGNDIDVSYITKEEFMKDMPSWKYIKYSKLYRDSKRIIRLRAKEA